MHGRVRGREGDAGKDAAEKEAIKDAISRKASMYTDLTALLTKMRKAGDTSQQALDLTSKILRINPDYYTLWNYRREVLLAMYGNSLGLRKERMDGLIFTTMSSTADHINGHGSPAAAAAANDDCRISAELGSIIRDQELNLSKEAIIKNPKTYGAWWHRVWVMQRFASNYEQELKLCSQFLDADQRNFHCWNYRRYVAIAGNVSPADEFQYSTEKIEQNFSNYSAFHHRSVFISQLGHRNMEAKQAALTVELAIVENATFTDPFDQSAWWYYRFLIQWMASHLEVSQQPEVVNVLLQQQQQQQQSLARDICREVLQLQVENLNSLSEAEPQCKWPVDALVFLLTMQRDLHVRQQVVLPLDQVADITGQIHAHLNRLKELDPQRVARYDYLTSYAAAVPDAPAA
jgi:geranylgeranyl transferase type-2 subunit alpha